MKHVLPFLILLAGLLATSTGTAQLDVVHWVPPLHSRDNGQINDHYLYLSTPETSPVTVNLYDGSGATFGDSPYTISNGSPVAIEIGNGQTSGSKLMVSQSELNETLTNRGIKVEASAPIFCNARHRRHAVARRTGQNRCTNPRSAQ